MADANTFWTRCSCFDFAYASQYDCSIAIWFSLPSGTATKFACNNLSTQSSAGFCFTFEIFLVK